MPAKRTRCISALAYLPIETAVEALRRCGQGFAVIAHKGEKIGHDEDGEVGKDHLHIIIDRSFTDGHTIPNLKKAFTVDTGDGCGRTCKLVGIRDVCVASQWHQYVLHDLKYLQSKGLEREFHYTEDDIVKSDMSFEPQFDYINGSCQSHGINVSDLYEAYKNGKSWHEFSATLPIALYPSARKAWRDIGFMSEYENWNQYIKVGVFFPKINKLIQELGFDDRISNMSYDGSITIVNYRTGEEKIVRIFDFEEIKGELEDEI